MSRVALAIAFVCALPLCAQAKEFKLGDEKPVASVTLPDSWNPETFDDGVEGTSPDKETYVAAEIINASELDQAGKDEDEFFAKQKIKIKPESKVEKKTTVNGLPAYDIAWDATDEDGPTHVSVTLVKIADSQLLMLTYWGTAAGETSNKADLQTIGQSITPIK